MPEKVLLSWSGGKDSAIALYEIQLRREYEVVSLDRERLSPITITSSADFGVSSSPSPPQAANIGRDASRSARKQNSAILFLPFNAVSPSSQ